MNISRFLQARPNVILFRYAPVTVSTRYLRLIGRLYYIANKKERIQIEKNIKDVFQSKEDTRKSKEDTRKIIERTFDGIFSHYSEKLIMAYRNLNQLKKEIGDILEYSGTEYLDNAIKNGGVVLVTGHFGGVEFMPLALHLRNYAVSMVVSFQNKRLKDSLMERAAKGNVELIDGFEENVLHKQMQAIKRGRILLTECDEVDAWNTKKNRTVHAFKGEIKLDRSVEILCRRTGAEVLCSFMVRTEKGYCLTIVPVKDYNKSHETDLASGILKTLEIFVMMFPDQWYQWKKFHKMRPGVA